MESITLTKIEKNNEVIEYAFTVTEGLRKYFSDKPFVITYPSNIENVPDAIAAVPFVCNVLPIIWLTDSKLIISELDKAFFECIPNVKKGYETMFPESTFAGEVVADKIVPCDRLSNGSCAAFFSGGLDATQTLVSHFDEKPHLISIWGADIRYDNPEGWEVVHNGIAESCGKFNLPDVVIRSSFREFDNEGALDKEFHEQLKDGWWHGVKHGIGLLGHAAPYAYLHGLSTVYIASSNCPANGLVRCASDPRIDNYVRFANVQVIHDGYEFSRQDKARRVVEFSKRSGRAISLHVCWQSQSGSNCCQCEKCYRTITALIAEGADPIKFGFEDAQQTLPEMQNYLIGQNRLSPYLAFVEWTHIKKEIILNQALLKNTPYWKDIKWISTTDFTHLKLKKPPIMFRIRGRLSKFKFYQVLHRLKEKL